MTGVTLHIPTLETPRLTLRAHRLGDFDAYAQTLASDRARHMVEDPSRGQAWASFVNDVASWSLHPFGVWAVDLKDGTHVGQVGINQPEYFPEPELGWILHDGHEGRGYATEAARAACYWATGKVRSLVSYITPTNAGSIAVALRLGASHDTAASLPDGEDATETHVYRHWGPA